MGRRPAGVWVRRVFVHEADITMSSEADLRSPGAAVTVSLCGHWAHRPPCATPHHTHAVRIDGVVRVRTLFAAPPPAEASVRRQIDEALRRGRLTGPDGTTSTWQLLLSRASAVRPEEEHRAGLLMRPQRREASGGTPRT